MSLLSPITGRRPPPSCPPPPGRPAPTKTPPPPGEEPVQPSEKLTIDGDRNLGRCHTPLQYDILSYFDRGRNQGEGPSPPNGLEIRVAPRACEGEPPGQPRLLSR